MTKLTFKLTRPAKKSGGDRYEAKVEGEDNLMVVYVPQSISRAIGQSVLAMEITFEAK
ncbi:hypothetical protein LCGC14_3053620 [marine sediment metagenome]|uniref:Uncharacterized protein n=1 Tax=marine sediment metagenome TaxID=412755 RepID=A0A0F8YTU2_9ZZZZ